MAQVEDTKKLGLLTGTDKKKNLHAAEDDDYITKLFEKYSTTDKKGNEIVTKANGYLAA